MKYVIFAVPKDMVLVPLLFLQCSLGSLDIMERCH